MDQQKKIMVTSISIAVIVVIVLSITLIQPPKQTIYSEPEVIVDTNQPTEQPMNSLGIEVMQKGSGPAAQKGNTVQVHYTGTLENGTKFDSSLDRGEPFSFTLGQNRVIQGWEQGVLGMQVGEKRKLTIPSDLGYGDGGFPPVIPPKATLIFEVELLGIQ